MPKDFLKNFTPEFAEIVDPNVMVIADGIFKGVKVTPIEEKDGTYTYEFTRYNKNGNPAFSVTINEPKISEETLIECFIDYLSKKCATKIVESAYNNFAKDEDKVFSEKEIPVSLKNTPPAFFAFCKDQLIESINNDTASLTVQKEVSERRRIRDKYVPNAEVKFENCVNRTFDSFLDLCEKKVWSQEPPQSKLDK